MTIRDLFYKFYMKKVLIITGGRTEEAEISKMSADSVSEKIKNRFEVIGLEFPREIDKLNSFKGEDIVGIPLVHGKGGEDGEIQRILDELKIKFVFSNPEVHKLCLDKDKTKKFLNNFGIRTPRSFSEEEISDDLNDDVIVKPIDGGSSLDTKMVSGRDEILEIIDKLKEESLIPLIEEFIKGREFSVSVIENSNEVQVLPIAEIKKGGEVFDFMEKYSDESLAQEIIPADIDKSLEEELNYLAEKIFNLLKCKHIARIDFIVNDKNQIYFLEINTIPGMTKNSIVTRCLEEVGISFDDLFEDWIKSLN